MASGYYWELKAGLQRKLGHALTMLLPQFLSLKNLWNSSSVTNKNEFKLCLVRPEERSHNCAATVWTSFSTEDNIKDEGVKPGLDLCPLQPLSAPQPQCHSHSSCLGTDPMLGPHSHVSRVPAKWSEVNACSYKCTAEVNALQMSMHCINISPWAEHQLKSHRVQPLSQGRAVFGSHGCISSVPQWHPPKGSAFGWCRSIVF